MERKKYTVIYTKGDEKTFMRSIIVEGYDEKDARDAFDAHFDDFYKVSIISITETKDKMTEEEADLCWDILHSVYMYSIYDESTGKYHLNGEMMSNVFGKHRMETLIHAMGKIKKLSE